MRRTRNALAAALLALALSAPPLMAANGAEAPPQKMLPFPGPTAEQAAQQEAKATAAKAVPVPTHAPASPAEKTPASAPQKSPKARYGDIIIHK